MGRGGFFNNSGRKSGGYRRHRFTAPVDPGRAQWLRILKEQVRASGLTGADLEEVLERLEATDADVLREAVTSGAIERAEQLAGTDNSDSPDSQKPQEGQN